MGDDIRCELIEATFHVTRESIEIGHEMSRIEENGVVTWTCMEADCEGSCVWSPDLGLATAKAHRENVIFPFKILTMQGKK